MIDSSTHAPVSVLTDPDDAPYIMVPLEQLASLEAVLTRNGISYWVDSEAISVNGSPEIIFVNFGNEVNAVQVQRLLDDAK